MFGGGGRRREKEHGFSLMNTDHSKLWLHAGLDDNAALRPLAQIARRDRALGRFRKLRNSSVASSLKETSSRRTGQKRYGEERKNEKKRRKDTRLLHDKGEAAAIPFVEIFRILLAPSEVAGRVFCITLYANETYALPEPRNKLHVYR